MTQLLTIVNENDEVIGSKERSAINYERDVYRVTALWMTNSKGEILLAQRAFVKENSPGLWGPAVSGTVEKGESYEENIYKEAGEEIGLTDTAFETGPKQRKKEPSTYRNYFAQWFTVSLDRPASFFRTQPDEVERVKWVKPEELVGDFEQHPKDYVPSMERIIETFIKNK